MTENEEAEVAEKCGEPSSVVSGGLPSVTDAEKDLALLSFQEFDRGNYERCLCSLQQLLGTRPSDPKVLHNKCVAEFYKTHCTEVEAFKKNLNQACSQAHMNLEDGDSLDDVDYCAIYYNEAVLLFHERQYHASIAMLDKVFQFIEPVGSLARKICFLLLELYLCTFQMDKGLYVINYIETTLMGSQPNNVAGKSHSPDKEKTGKDSPGSKEGVDSALNEAHRIKIQQYKVRLYMMTKSMRLCKREIKSLMNSVGVNPFTIYWKSNLEYLRGNYRKALKVLNTAPNPQRSAKEMGENLALMYYNNVGCIHFYMDKAHLGCYYFQKALEQNEQSLQEINGDGKIPLIALGVSRRYELLFNMGLQLLYARRPLQAFDCLMEAIQVYTTNPRLWLRLAECCIMVHKADNGTDFRIFDCNKNMVQRLVGKGNHRKLILSSGVSLKWNNSDNQSAAMPMPTLEFASLCLKNSLLLLQEDCQTQGSLANSLGSDDAEPSTLGSSDGTNSHSVSGLPGYPIKGHEVSNLRISVLTASAYVSLCLGDVVMALHYSDLLLGHPRLSGVHKLLGHLYAGEALILLDRISDAIQHLNPEHVKDAPFSFVFSDKDEKEKQESSAEHSLLQGWYPNSSTTARLIMQYNLTVAFALRGEYEKASEILRQIGAAQNICNEVPIQAVMLAMYIQLQQGHADVAKNIIKQYCPQFS